jgi:hypothetical protein
MQIFPYHSEILILPFHVDEVLKKLKLSVLFERTVFNPEEHPKTYLFVGQINDYSFRIFRKITQSDNYLPLISGRLENTSSGCILFIKYRLFKSTSFFLIFWSTLSIGLCIFFLFFYKQYIYAVFSLILGIGNYIVTVIIFTKHTNRDKILLHELLSI